MCQVIAEIAPHLKADIAPVHFFLSSHTYICTHIFTHIFQHRYLHRYVYTHIYTRIFAHMYLHTYNHAHVFTQIFTHLFTYTLLCAYKDSISVFQSGFTLSLPLYLCNRFKIDSVLIFLCEVCVCVTQN